jgi:hypothetical protein
MKYVAMFGRGLVAVVGLLALGGTPAWAQHHGHHGHGEGFGGHGGFSGGPGAAAQQRNLGRIEGMIGGLTGYVPNGYQISHMSGAEARGYLEGMRFDRNLGLTGALQLQPTYLPPQPYYPPPQPTYVPPQPYYPQPQVVWDGYRWVQVP